MTKKSLKRSQFHRQHPATRTTWWCGIQSRTMQVKKRIESHDVSAFDCCWLLPIPRIFLHFECVAEIGMTIVSELQDTSSYLPSVHGSHREDGMVDVEASNGARAQSVSGPPPFRYPTSEIGKLVFGAGGIYVSFLYYGSLQEDVFRFKGEDDGHKFVYAWWLQFLEAAANVLVSSVGQRREQQQQSHTTITTAKSLTTSDDASASGCNGHCGNTCNIHATTRQERLPLLPFFASGASQVISKACTSLALAHGLSFPVATLAKSGKMAPVMVGQLILGGSHYSARDYLQVLAIIAGTALLSMGNSSKVSFR